MGKRMFMLVLICFLISSATAFAQVHVNGYTRSNGTYVQPYVKTQPNSNTYDNYSTKGNTNPYTGRAGTVNPIPSYPSNVYKPYKR